MPEAVATNRNEARVQQRIAELEALAADDTTRGDSPRLVNALLAEWRAHLRAMRDRSEALSPAIAERAAQTPLPASSARGAPGGAGSSVAEPRVSRLDLDRADQELAEVRGHVDYLEALVAQDMRWGNPTKRSRDLLAGHREHLHQLLSRRTAMFIAFVTGQ